MARSIRLWLLACALVPAAALAQGTVKAAPMPIGEGAASKAPAAAQKAPAPADRPAAAAGSRTDDPSSVRTLEERVNDLKERIFRTKARLMNLQEMVIGGDVTGGSKAVLVHRNEMGSAFVLESVAYALDGAPVYTKVDARGDLDRRDEFEIFNGRIVPGNHQVSVQLVYRGNGHGVFSYVDAYKFKVQSSYAFAADPGKAVTIRVVGYEKGGLTTELQDRPAVRYDIDLKKEDARAPAASTPGGLVPASTGGSAR